MIVQHNIMALNSYNRLGTNNNAVQKNLEKLSSGYRINRAGDDAAGLAISEKMRAQITGLERAQLNAKDGISLVQTAEGALTEVHSMLNRLVELGVESANGIYQATDRDKIQAEVNQITEEIDRISKSTNFNGIKLLDGSLGSSTANVDGGSAITATQTDATQAQYVGANAVLNGVTFASLTKGDVLTVTVNTRINGTDSAQTFSLTYNPDKHTQLSDLQDALNAQIKEAFGADFKVTDNTQVLTFEAKEAGADKAIVSGMSWTVKNYNDSASGVVVATGSTSMTETKGVDAYTTVSGFDGGATALTKTSSSADVEKNTLTINGQKFVMVKDKDAAANVNKIDSGINVIVAKDLDQAAADIEKATGIKVAVDGNNLKVFAPKGAASGGAGLTLQVGDTADSFNKVTVSVDNMSSAGLGVNGLTVTDQGIAADSITRVKSAIEKVSVNRGRLGALQNRLEHTLNNLATTTENMTNAESRIRDTDMAQEMMAFTKNNVLVQAAQSMLAQANQQPQQVLQLLR
ncbi:flagellin [bacterium 1XD42-1]|nr:flagellin [bacterium 1XD42-8]RKJ65608.1 flagellin [bacterium 1XD42-1]